MEDATAAERFPVGEFLADEIDERGWSQGEFAEILGRPAQFVSEIIAGKKEITRESAAQIGAALGTSAEMWLNLQDSYLLWRQSQDKESRRNLDAVRMRARVREMAPVSLLKKRGFISSDDPAEQVEEILRLYEMKTFDDDPQFAFAARRSNVEAEVSTIQTAWVACVRRVARDLRVAPYTSDPFRALAHALSPRARDPREFAAFQSDFADVGVRLVYVESFPGSKLDGCSFMVGRSPVIGISGRGKRLDKVLFTLLHEVAHVLLEHVSSDGGVIVDDLSVDGQGMEQDADDLAAELAISGPLPTVPARPTRSWLNAEADALNVHPLTLVGRLQKLERLSWNTTLVKGAPSVTEYLETWAAG